MLLKVVEIVGVAARTQVSPFPKYPAKHWQEYDPGVLVHAASLLQLFPPPSPAQ